MQPQPWKSDTPYQSRWWSTQAPIRQRSLEEQNSWQPSTSKGRRQWRGEGFRTRRRRRLTCSRRSGRRWRSRPWHGGSRRRRRGQSQWGPWRRRWSRVWLRRCSSRGCWSHRPTACSSSRGRRRRTRRLEYRLGLSRSFWRIPHRI